MLFFNALIKQAKKLPTGLDKSLTLDRGSEFAAHKRFSEAAGIDVYFCGPQQTSRHGGLGFPERYEYRLLAGSKLDVWPKSEYFPTPNLYLTYDGQMRSASEHFRDWSEIFTCDQVGILLLLWKGG